LYKKTYIIIKKYIVKTLYFWLLQIISNFILLIISDHS